MKRTSFLIAIFVALMIQGMDLFSLPAQTFVFQQPVLPAGTVNSMPVQIGQPIAVAANEDAVTSVPASSSPANAKTPEQTKVDLLLKAKFDRTTPTILKAWSDFPKVDETKTDSAADSALTAIVENAFKGFVVIGFEQEPKWAVGDLLVVKQEIAIVGTVKLLTLDGKTATAQFIQPPGETTKLATADNAGPTVTVPAAESDQPKNESADDANAIEQIPDAAIIETNEPTPVAATETAKDKPDGYDVLSAGDSVSLTKFQQPDPNQIAQQQVRAEVDQFVRNVTLGNWDAVKKFLAGLKPDEADKVYAHLLLSLASAPQPNPGQPRQVQPGQTPVSQNLTPNDILQLADASPQDIRLPQPQKDPESAEDLNTELASETSGNVVQLPPGITIEQLPPEALEQMEAQGMIVATGDGNASAGTEATAELNHLEALAKLISNSLEAGHDFSEFFDRIKSGTRHFGGEDALKKLTAADLFLKSNLIKYVEPFLPKLDDESTTKNFPALKLWSQLALALHAEKNVAEWLERAWRINQDILLIEDIPASERDLALSNLIELSSKIEQEIGVAWMNASFTEVPQRGMTILTNLGTRSADYANQATQIDEGTRLGLLRLQNEAVEDLIRIAPEKADAWRQTLTLLAQTWLKESEISLQYSQENSRGSYMDIDMYGNYFWVNQNQRMQMYGGNNRQPRPIKLGDMIEIAPSEKWQQLIHPTLHTNLQSSKANLYLRINEEDKAFPFIEQMATEHPDKARDLVHEFLTIWTRNHDPNSDRRQRNPYIYFYGFDQKAEAIPLTRSKQERNIEELAGWVQRIRGMPIEDVDEKLLADAFTTCHSSAEVFQLQRFRDVFGDLGKMKPETIAAMSQKMRENLAANWREIKNQEEKQTNRREPEVQQEVLNGYETGLALLAEALATSPEDWQLNLCKAAMMYDQNAYSQSIQKSSEFSDRRDQAFDQFALAAKKYEAVVASLEDKDQSTEVFDTWFYAGLGACDLGRVTDRTVPDLRQYAKIRAAIQALPGNLAEDHMARFANNLFTRMSPIKPEMKFRYLRGGFEIAGDHPRAWEARNLFDYYRDLVSEIKLMVSIDGADVVGHSQPFGVYINILHTVEIERESGGFGKYVQNQNTMMFAYNYGRPTENYRDKFSDSVDLALGEHFEVLNITFQSPELMTSLPAPQPGWRITPYAYLLLKPKGSEVDRIAPLKLDLDFLDTSGYVVIPIESPALIVDASSGKAPIRPVADLKITQTLDERQADEGRLIVEISASAKGLVPELDRIIDLKRDNFELVSVDDQGVLPNSFDKDSDEIQILSDRSWTVEYKAADSNRALEEFTFSNVVLAGANAKFQRYNDADIVDAEQIVKLERSYGSISWSFLYWLIPVIVLGLLGCAAIVYSATRPVTATAQRFSMPAEVNPFTVLTLLQDIKAHNGISREKQTELESSIHRIEQYYFGELEADTPEDLAQVAESWIRLTR